MQKKLISSIFLIFGIFGSVFSQWNDFVLPTSDTTRYQYFILTNVKITDADVEVDITIPYNAGMDEDHYPKADDSITFFPIYTDKGKWCQQTRYKIKKSSNEVDEDENDVLTLHLYPNPGACVLEEGGLAQLSGAPMKVDSPTFLYLVGDDAIKLNSSIDETILPPDEEPETVFNEWDQIQNLLKDLKSSSATMVTQRTPLVTEGPYAGKTAYEILNLTTAKDVIDFLNFLVSYPRKFMGKDWKFSEIYLGWIKAKQPKGTQKEKDLYTKYDLLTKIKEIPVDYETGMVDGLSVASTADEIMNQMPYFDDIYMGKTVNCRYHVTWSVCSNSLIYYRDQKCFEFRKWHEGTKDKTLFGKSPDQIKTSLGEPVKISKISLNDAWFYSKPYGSLCVIFSGSFSRQYVSKLRMYSVPIESIVDCK